MGLARPFFNLITGLIKPTTGDIKLNGQSIVDKAPHEVTAQGVAHFPKH